MQTKGLRMLIFLVGLAIVIMLGFSCQPIFVAEADSYDYWDTYVFEINTQHDFDDFCQQFHSQTLFTFAGKKIVLNTDVVANYSLTIPNFSGIFLGNGYKISSPKSALFSVLSSNAVVQDLFINNFTLQGSFFGEKNEGVIDSVTLLGEVSTTAKVTSLVTINNGTIKNSTVSVDYSLSRSTAGFGGVVYQNNGIIKNTSFLGDVVVTDNISYMTGFVYNNNGTIIDCNVNTDFEIVQAGVDAVLPTNISKFATYNSSAIKNCGVVTTFAGYEVEGVQVEYLFVKNNYESGVVEKNFQYHNNEFTVNTTNNTFVSGAYNSFINEDFYTFSDKYPINKSYLGYDNGMFLINNLSDWFKIEFFDFAYDVSVCDDINFQYLEKNIKEFNGDLHGNGYVFSNAKVDLFGAMHGEVSELGWFYTNSEISVDYTLGVDIFDENSLYDYGYSDMNSSLDVALATPLMGDGSEENPYIITKKEELASLNGSDQYYKLGKNILINNNTINDDYLLNIGSFDGVLDGCGYYIIGLVNETFIANNNGIIKNINFRGYYNTDIGKIAETNNGTITNVSVLNSGEIGYLINNNTTLGIVEKVANFDLSPIMVNDNDGVVKNIFNHKNTNIADSKISTSFYRKNGVLTAISEDYESGVFEYFDLKERGYDFNNIFGYEKGQALPSLRVSDKEYKKEYNLLDYNFNPNGNVFYKPNEIYYVNSIQNVVNPNPLIDVEFSWTYNGEDFTNSSFSNAGVYQLTAIFSSNDEYMSQKSVQTYEIKKAKCLVRPSFDSGEFSNINEVYSGENVTINNPVANNLDDYNFDYSYSIVDTDDNPISAIKNAGTYYQVIDFDSTNYESLQRKRVITISKKGLVVSIGDIEVDYNQSATLTNASVTIVSGLVDSDLALSMEDLALADSEEFVCSYVVGDDVGEYDLDYSVDMDNYYIETLTKGKVEVVPIDMPDYGISFEDLTEVYTGDIINLAVSNLPSGEGFSVAYTNNENKNVSSTPYEVKAVISKDNYNDMTLVGYLTITKKSLTLTADNKTFDYGYVYDFDDFSYSEVGLIEGESLNDYINGYKIYKNGVEVSALVVGEYDIVMTFDEESTIDNYQLTINNGILSINQASLTSLYASHSDFVGDYSGAKVEHLITYFDSGYSVVYRYTIGSEEVESCINSGVYDVSAVVTPTDNNYKETTYNYTITINKISRDIDFERSSYAFDYNGEDLSLDINYTGDLVENPSVTLQRFVGAVSLSEAKDKGTYSIKYVFGETKNYKETTIQTTLVINQKSVKVVLKNSYVYNNQNIELVALSISENYDSLEVSDFNYLFMQNNIPISGSVVNVGSYQVVVSAKNTNYIVVESNQSVSITKREVGINLNKLEYSYGTLGNLRYGGQNYNIAKNLITIMGYYIEETFTYIDISYNISSYEVGSYVINSIIDTSNYDFEVSEDSKNNKLNVVKIIPAELDHLWKVSGVQINSNIYQSAYMGVDQSGLVNYMINGLMYNDKELSLGVEVTINDKQSYAVTNVGEYTYKLKITSTNNYVFKKEATLLYKIIPVDLEFYISDAEVESGDRLGSVAYTTKGKVGLDIDKNILTLLGAKVDILCGYIASISTPGEKHNISVSASFTNYNVVIKEVGTLTVLHNTSPVLTMEDKTFIYDGQPKFLAVSGNTFGKAEVTYSMDNGAVDVGVYNITATIDYTDPNKENKYITRTLTIKKATPSVSVGSILTAFVEDYVLPTSFIDGRAVLNDEVCAGEFSFIGQTQLQLGKREYVVRFTPSDSKNINSVDKVISVETVSINSSIFRYDPVENVDGVKTNGIDIKDSVTLRMDTTILPNLTLYRNNLEVTYITFNREETLNIAIKYLDTIIYNEEWVVRVIEEEEEDSVMISPSIIFGVTGAIRMESDKIVVGVGGGSIFVNEKFREDITLYVNGQKTLEYTLDGSEGELNFVVKEQKNGFVLWSKKYEVTPGVVNVGDDKGESYWSMYKNYYITAIVVVSVAIVATLVVTLLLKRRKKNKDFNPYQE